jgi:hypothetical protein
MRAAAIVLSVVAVAAMAAAIRDMVLGSEDARRGWTLRSIAVLAFALAVVLNLLAG